MKIEIEHIREAEKLLLGEGFTFNPERVDFITNLTSFDLMAVPGSGKTTALNAKLYCMSKQLPIHNGVGILVLSHTNAAVDEIKSHLQSVCPDLFQYPNFVGTVQEFVDTFLAFPYFYSLYGKKVDCVDDDRHNEVLNHILNKPNSFTGEIRSSQRFIGSLRLGIGENEDFLTDSVLGDKLKFGDYRCWTNLSEEDKRIKQERYYNYLLKVKMTLIKNGILCYDDCYYLANKQIKNAPRCIEILRNRFKYVFVDETQDLTKYQLDILDQLFDVVDVAFQRIGDPNQSIYSSADSDCDWVVRNPTFLHDSLRLTPTIGKFVTPFMLNKGQDDKGQAKFVVNGVREIGAEIRPVLILYDDASEKKLKETFEKLITGRNLLEVPERKYGFHIVGWNANESTNADAKRLQDIFPIYQKRLAQRKPTYLTLNDYVNSCYPEADFKYANKACLNAICRATIIAGVKDNNGRTLNVNTFISYIESNKQHFANEIKSLLLQCCKKITQKEFALTYELLKDFITSKLCEIFEINLSEAILAFVGNAYSPVIEVDPHTEGDLLPIEIGTVHSVKGNTHCATMYVETYNNKKYESERLLTIKSSGRGANRIISYMSPLFGDNLEHANLESLQRQSIKMMYVAFSRPTHLLCYASHISRWNQLTIQRMYSYGWLIENISGVEVRLAEPLM